MRYSTLVIAFTLLGPGWIQAQEKKQDLNELSLEITALQTLDSLELGPKQLKMLADWAQETMEKPRQRKSAKASGKYRKTLIDLHAALVKNDEELVGELDGKLEELREAEQPELDNGVEITKASRVRGPELLRKLRVTQIGPYLGNLTFTDPFEVLKEVLDQSQDLKGQEWKDARDEAATTIGKLLGGVDAAKSSEAGSQVRKFLDRAHGLKKGDFKLMKLRQEGRMIVQPANPLDVIRNQVEYDLAELLSNPRLAAALEIRLKNPAN